MGERFDAVVIGGGPGGATSALLLAQAGWSVALVEKKAFPRRKVCGEYLSATNWPLLKRLGIAEEFHRRAGPEVRRVGLFAGGRVLMAPLPDNAGHWGRALGREHLDTLLLERARAAGATVVQPAGVKQVRTDGNGYRCAVEGGPDLRCNVVIAAHGFWEPGPLPSQPAPTPARPDDLLAFKAHFSDSNLPGDLMPLLAFPGGYGGMVHTDAGRVTISCCVCRSRLAVLRSAGDSAGDAVLSHIARHCRGAREALHTARRDGPWLAAGPIRPGIRVRPRGGVFAVGNAAGEAHPVIAEGISMAMQSAWLLTRRLVARLPDRHRQSGTLAPWQSGRAPNQSDWGAVGIDYARAWRRAFAPRLRAAAVFAHWAMRPATVGPSLPLLAAFPALLRWGALFSGKATTVVR
jgi:2-polyprenyl-6-methoxyphenol hydroxylase-like FAD-dependent oxidoreductase